MNEHNAFSDKSYDAVGFKSSWKTERSSENTAAQTMDCAVEEKECQSVSSNSVEVQTDVEEAAVNAATEVDNDKLAAFLKRICPSILAELDKVEQSNVLRQHESKNGEFEGEIQKRHVLQPSELNGQNEMKASSVSWSCTGSVVAFGLSFIEHDNWCRHISHVAFYNINRQDFSPNTPMRTVETSACVTSLSAHPYEPSIIAVGLFSGAILIWNLQDDEDCLYSSSANKQGGHEDAVTQVSWVPSPDLLQQGVMLVSSGRDGRIVVWHVGTGKGSLRLVEVYAISLENSISGSMARTPLDGGVDTALGVTCFSFTARERSRLIVGVEGGGLLDCTTLTSKPATVRSDVPMKDPVLGLFEGHQGSVTSVQCSPSEEIFVSCGTDKELHIYSLKELTPIKVIFADSAFVGVAWCPSNGQLVAAWGESGVNFYNHHSGEPVSSLKLVSEGKHPICSLHFNPRSGQVLATGDVCGKVVIWQVPLGHV